MISQKFLQGSDRDELLQRVATVYDGDLEYWVLAPSQATGPALEWLTHLRVRKPAAANTEEEVENARRTLVLRMLEQELEKRDRDADEQ